MPGRKRPKKGFETFNSEYFCRNGADELANSLNCRGYGQDDRQQDASQITMLCCYDIIPKFPCGITNLSPLNKLGWAFLGSTDYIYFYQSIKQQVFTELLVNG